MFYVNKKDKTDIIEIIHSDNLVTIIVSHKKTKENPNGNPTGFIKKGSKKNIKNIYKKASEKITKDVIPVQEHIKREILDTYERDKLGITVYTEEYMDINKRWELAEERQELQSMTDEEYKSLLRTLADK
jgi:hypothetical protein